MIKRFYNLKKYLKQGRAVILFGPRRVGKTTLLNDFLKDSKLKYRLEIGDNISVQKILSSQDFDQILEFVKGIELLVIDEAQQIPNIGMGLKIIVDQRPDIYVIATGSSSFDLAKQVGEPLTGRKRTLTLFPISILELSALYNKYDLGRQLESHVIYGTYPEVATAESNHQKELILKEIANSYLLKDILAIEKIKGSHKIYDLLTLLAHQVGSEVSLHELSTRLQIDVKTVSRYIDLLEKSYILIRLGGLSRNLRKEVSRKCKYYFYDNGIRNAIIDQFNPISKRNDIGQLWENFLIVERLKCREYKEIFGHQYFWRTYDGQEIDLIEEREGKFFAYEFKWSDIKKSKIPKSWTAEYKNSEYKVINKDNYLDFVTQT